jgi:glucokinase
MSEPVVLAVDAGGSSIKSALVETNSRIVGGVSLDAIESKASADRILNTLAAIIKDDLQNFRGVHRIAFAFPGPFDYEQGVCLIQNQDKYNALYGLDLSTSLKEMLGLPNLEVRYRNDAEAAILGEALYGAGVPYSHLIGITLGTGLESAFIAERNLITDGDSVPPHGWLYACMFENQRADDVFSIRGLLARMRERGIDVDNLASAMQHKDNNNLTQVFALFGSDLGTFLTRFVLDFRAAAVLVLGSRAALLGAAVLYF